MTSQRILSESERNARRPSRTTTALPSASMSAASRNLGPCSAEDMCNASLYALMKANAAAVPRARALRPCESEPAACWNACVSRLNEPASKKQTRCKQRDHWHEECDCRRHLDTGK